jgi:hypothetical protein
MLNPFFQSFHHRLVKIIASKLRISMCGNDLKNLSGELEN